MQGRAASYQVAQSVAAVYVFSNAFERARSLDPERVREAIAIMDLKTFYRPIKFHGSGKNVAKPMVLTRSSMVRAWSCGRGNGCAGVCVSLSL